LAPKAGRFVAAVVDEAGLDPTCELALGFRDVGAGCEDSMGAGPAVCRTVAWAYTCVAAGAGVGALVV
jgi:hypothetical protein